MRPHVRALHLSVPVTNVACCRRIATPQWTWNKRGSGRHRTRRGAHPVPSRGSPLPTALRSGPRAPQTHHRGTRKLYNFKNKIQTPKSHLVYSIFKSSHVDSLLFNQCEAKGCRRASRGAGTGMSHLSFSRHSNALRTHLRCDCESAAGVGPCDF